tara:strand:+ start:896 stop:2656 length:1761 start_codon:yes stop_codon:yes gene_type:complete
MPGPKFNTKSRADIEADSVYGTFTLALASQGKQEKGEIIRVTDASDHPDGLTGTVYFEYLGTTNGDERDYEITFKKIDSAKKNILYAEDRGLIADGITDDTAKIQEMFNEISNSLQFDTVIFPEKTYKINGKLTINSNVKVIGYNTKFITSNIITVFESTATDVKIFGITQNSTVRSEFFRQKADFNKIEIAYCEQNLPENEQANYLFIGDEGLNGKELVIYSNETNNVTPVFFDNNIEGKKLDILRVGANISKNCPRYFCRVLGVNTDTPYVGNAYIRDNEVSNINGNIVDASAVVARFFQTGVIGTIHLTGNTVNGAKTGTNGNFLYLAGGSLICNDNIVSGIQSISSSSIIQDKKLREDGETWNIFNNTFDFSEVLTANTPKSIIQVLNRDGAFVENNIFKGLKCYAVDVAQTVLDDPTPQNITISRNKIMDIDYPIVFNLQQQLKNVSISGNEVFKIDNTAGININGTSDCRLVSMYNTFNQEKGQENIDISDNKIYECSKSVYFATMYINAAAPTAIKDKVIISGNKFLDMTTPFNKTYVRFIGTLQNNMTNVKIVNNMSAVAATETVGTEPADLEKINNM